MYILFLILLFILQPCRDTQLEFSSLCKHIATHDVTFRILYDVVRFQYCYRISIDLYIILICLLNVFKLVDIYIYKTLTYFYGVLYVCILSMILDGCKIILYKVISFVNRSTHWHIYPPRLFTTNATNIEHKCIWLCALI